jgi:DNA gyrase/topoisomerase IV subunit B
LKTEDIVEETQREAIINRPWNLGGSIKTITKEKFKISGKDIVYGETATVPCLMKLFMESLDNPIDVAIKGGCTKIDIVVDNHSIQVIDNGWGVSTKKQDGEYILYKAFCKYNTSSNYGDNKGKGQKGVNGIGIKLCTTLSKTTTIISDDGNKQATLVVDENNLIHKVTTSKSTGKTGINIKFFPDFDIFDGEHIDEEHKERMYEYILMQSMTYPKVKFTFNKKAVKLNPKQFLKLIDSSGDLLVEETEDYFFAITKNPHDDFKQLSYVNGLETWKAGTHIDFVMNKIISGIREKLVKKFKTIKPGDIKNKLTLVLVAKNMKDVAWDGQTKESISSSVPILSEYFKGTDFSAYTNKLVKDKELMESITEIFKLKEELRKKQEMDKLDKPNKKFKSDKYTPSIGKLRILMICEGQSACGGILPVFGRTNIGYWELKGKPLNIKKASHAKFLANEELSNLYKLLKKEKPDYIISATDQDLDGIAIRALLLGFYEHFFLEELKNGQIGHLTTPVAVEIKNKKVVKWVYSLNDIGELKNNVKYMKGLGSWKEKDLKNVVKKDGLNNIIEIYDGCDSDDVDTINDWLQEETVDVRKMSIMKNDFDLIKL